MFYYEFLREIIIKKNYVRFFYNDRFMFDIFCTGFYIKKDDEFKWELLEIIKCNSEDWDFDEGKESGINFKFGCVKFFMDIDVFRDFSIKYGFDSEIVVYFYEYFVIYVDFSEEKWFIYYFYIEVKVVEFIKVEEEIIIYNVDFIVFTVYIEKLFFSVRIKDRVKDLTVVYKSYIKIFIFFE